MDINYKSKVTVEVGWYDFVENLEKAGELTDLANDLCEDAETWALLKGLEKRGFLVTKTDTGYIIEE